MSPTLKVDLEGYEPIAFEDIQPGDTILIQQDRYKPYPSWSGPLTVYATSRFRGHTLLERISVHVNVNINCFPGYAKYYRVIPKGPKLPTEAGTYILIKGARKPNHTFEFSKGTLARLAYGEWLVVKGYGAVESFKPEEITDWSNVTINEETT